MPGKEWITETHLEIQTIYAFWCLLHKSVNIKREKGQEEWTEQVTSEETKTIHKRELFERELFKELYRLYNCTENCLKTLMITAGMWQNIISITNKSRSFCDRNYQKSRKCSSKLKILVSKLKFWSEFGKKNLSKFPKR